MSVCCESDCDTSFVCIGGVSCAAVTIVGIPSLKRSKVPAVAKSCPHSEGCAENLYLSEGVKSIHCFHAVH